MFQLLRRRRFKKSSYAKIDDSVSLAVAAVQSATLLDEAAEAAIQNRDVAEMLAVAIAWAEMGIKVLGEEEESEGSVEEVLSDTRIVGFASAENREAWEDEESESDRKNGL